ncbi:MAG: DUF968 domain-containing protein [Planctomycetes bacterium]|nr:DUF968 domain-containing protein [Planctomycetota bacterium]
MKPRVDKRLPERPSKQRREGESPKHRRNVAALGCVLCGRAADPHHLMGLDKGRGMGMRNTDRWAIPICRKHHDEAHAAGDDEAYLAQHGVDARALASSLWASRDDVEGMRRVVFRFHQMARP